ncbi:MAG TPA: MgtC/SapB family protein, partial [Acinetobacter pseudolwoffii]|nr:MgtC/SapB family protein [Acinetobacter pseudolwoffii]
MDFSVVPFNSSSSFQELLAILTAALGCGLLIGLERERHKQREQQPSFAGLRSFAICALLGALCFLFGMGIGLAGALIVGGMVIFSIRNQPEDPGITTELAFI